MAMAAGSIMQASVDPDYQTSRFTVLVSGEPVFVPNRIHLIATAPSGQARRGIQGQIEQCFLTRSTDGFLRQKALRQILPLNQPWSVPFVIALIGEYVIEIIDDIYQAISSMEPAVIRDFLVSNPDFYDLIKARVTSYWDCYHRRLQRGDYSGFKILHEFGSIVRAPSPATSAEQD
jgi:hypothetical protein